MMMMTTTRTTNEEQEEEAVSFTTNWKLYDNPFFQIPSFSSQSHFHKHLVRKYSASAKHINRLHRDLKFDYPSSKINLGIDQARTQIAQLKDELEFERKMRKKAESLNKMMARELVDQRREREQMCDNLTKEITHLKSELEKTKTEITQKKVVKLTEKLPRNQKPQKLINNQKPFTVLSSSSCSTSSSSSNSTSMAAVGKQPKRSSESEDPHIKNSQNVTFLPFWENPHIKRGIKGFVEFPRVVKEINGSISDGSKCREMGITKMECQKAQLKILLKQKSSLSSNNLVVG